MGEALVSTNGVVKEQGAEPVLQSVADVGKRVWFQNVHALAVSCEIFDIKPSIVTVSWKLKATHGELSTCKENFRAGHAWATDKNTSAKKI